VFLPDVVRLIANNAYLTGRCQGVVRGSFSELGVEALWVVCVPSGTAFFRASGSTGEVALLPLIRLGLCDLPELR